MAKHHYVYSTASNDTAYAKFAPREEGNNLTREVGSRIVIKGGANVIDPTRLLTPKGVMTRVTDEQMQALLEDPAFNRHVKAGYITHSEVKEEADEVAKDMTALDGSAQKTAKTIGGKAKPVSADDKE